MLHYLKKDKIKIDNNVDILFLRHDADCGYIYKGKVYSPLIDSIVDIAGDLGINFVSMARPFSSSYGKTAHNAPYCFNQPFFLIALFSRLLSLFASKKIVSKTVKVLKEKQWRRILSLINPNVVIAIQPDKYLCAVAKRMNVKVYDLQHGVIGENHLWYGKKLRYELEAQELPNGILCWNDETVNWLRTWSTHRGVEPILIGHPWFDRFFEPSESDALVTEALKTSNEIGVDKPSVLVSLQWGLYDHYYQGTEFNGLMCDALINAIKKTSGKVNWFLRLHPVQMVPLNKNKVYRQLSNFFSGFDNIYWEIPSMLALPLILRKADLHITDMSSVVIEASMVGVPSALLNPHLKAGGKLEDLYSRERKMGNAELVDQTELDIVSWIDSRMAGRKEAKYNSRQSDLHEFLTLIKTFRAVA
jgi:hypothetical protein